MSNSFVEVRFLICNSCPYNESGECILCGCNLAEKTAKKEESCPLTPPKWGPEQDSNVPAKLVTGSVPKPAPYCIPCNRR